MIPVPCDTRFGISLHRAAHVAFVAFGRGVKLQRYDEGGGALQITVLHGWCGHRKLLWKRRELEFICILIVGNYKCVRQTNTPFFFSIPQVWDSEGADVPMSFLA